MCSILFLRVKYLPKVDKIVVMKDGMISEQGTYNQLLKAGGPVNLSLFSYPLFKMRNLYLKVCRISHGIFG